MTHSKASVPRYIPILLGTYFVIIGLILAISLNAGISASSEGDIANWVSLIVEVGIGIAITIAVWQYSKSEQEKMNQLVSSIKTVTEKLDRVMSSQEAFRENRRAFAINKIRSYLPMLRRHVKAIDSLTNEIAYSPSEATHEKEEMLAGNEEQRKYFLNELELVVEHFSDVLEAPIVAEIIRICGMAALSAEPPEMRLNPLEKELDASAVATEIDKLLDSLPQISL